MPTFFVVERRRGPQWDVSQPLEGQSGWVDHAAFMDGLVDDGFVMLGGPLAAEHRVVLVIEAESEDEVRDVLGRDPWSGTHLVVESVDAWTIRLDGRTRRACVDDFRLTERLSWPCGIEGIDIELPSDRSPAEPARLARERGYGVRSGGVTVEDLSHFAATFPDLIDGNVMDQAWA